MKQVKIGEVWNSAGQRIEVFREERDFVRSATRDNLTTVAVKISEALGSLIDALNEDQSEFCIDDDEKIAAAEVMRLLLLADKSLTAVRNNVSDNVDGFQSARDSEALKEAHRLAKTTAVAV